MMRWTEIREDREPFHHKGSIIFYAGDARCRVTPEEDILYIDKVYSREEGRGKGDAKRVVAKAIAYIDDLHLPSYLVAMPDNDEDLPRLIQFYQRFGFQLDANDPNRMSRPAQ